MTSIFWPDEGEGSNPYKLLGGGGEHAPPDPGYWAVQILTTSNNQVFQMNMTGASGLLIEWGDTQTDTTSLALIQHIYATPGAYEIRISGTVNSVNFFNGLANAAIRGTSIVGGCPALTSMAQTFRGCDNVNTEIPEHMFIYATLITDMQAVFRDTTFTALGENLFEGCELVTTYNNVFRDTPNLTETIPSNIFEDSPVAKDFGAAFRNSGFTGVVPAIFANQGPGPNDFTNCFRDSKISGLSGALFDNKPNVNFITSVFRDATNLTVIPNGLFDGIVNCTGFSFIFEGCTALTTVPDALFDGQTPSATTFEETFNGCAAITSNVPNLWDDYPAAPPPTPTNCFTGCTNAANFASVPLLWRS